MRILKNAVIRGALHSAAAALILGLMSASLRAQPSISVPPQSETVPTNFTASFAVFWVNNAPPYGFTWYFNNQPIQGATNFNLNIFNAQQTNVGSYVVVITNLSGSATSTPPAILTLTNVQVQAPSLQFSTLNSFNKFVNGAFPQAKVIQGSDGFLYGTTLHGGTNDAGFGGDGTVFKMSTNGTFIWSLSFNDADGSNPAAGLVQAGDGNFYGTTATGGNFGFGTVFRITPGGALTSLFDFTNAVSDGGFPEADLCLGADGYLYGTTTTNGAGTDGGTLFKMDTNGNFKWGFPLNSHSAIGLVPLAGLVQGADGNFYGTASEGGTNGGNGTVFMVTSNGVAARLYSFKDGTDGGFPEAGLVQGPDGQFYGSTTSGGNTNLNGGQGFGTLFKITTNGALTTLAAFGGTNGANPLGSLFLAGDGNFYGTANAGGVGAQASFGTLFQPAFGTIFQLTTNGTLSTLLSFNGNYNGAAPHSTLAQGRDGGLYGTTSEGGAYDLSTGGDGTVFRLSVMPPTIQSAARTGPTFSFSWNAMVGELYQPQYKDSLTQPSWINLGGLVSGTNGTAIQADTIGATNLQRFYRVLLPY